MYSLWAKGIGEYSDQRIDPVFVKKNVMCNYLGTSKNQS